jgi:glycolate oxidase
VVVGSEGTLGIVTQVTLRVVRVPEAVRTLLAGFRTMDAGGAAVSEIVAAGILPSAIEMMDRLTIEAAELAVSPGYPEDAGAVLLVELDGVSEQVEDDTAEIERICLESGAFELRTAVDEADRARLWRGRKSAFAAMGRIAANQAPRGASANRGALGKPRVERRQRLPRRRRQPPSARPLRRGRR